MTSLNQAGPIPSLEFAPPPRLEKGLFKVLASTLKKLERLEGAAKPSSDKLSHCLHLRGPKPNNKTETTQRCVARDYVPSRIY